MTGPEHYRTAERLLSAASHYTGDPSASTDAASIVREAKLLTAQAQAHATLALAAATALSHLGVSDRDIAAREAWAKVTR